MSGSVIGEKSGLEIGARFSAGLGSEGLLYRDGVIVVFLVGLGRLNLGFAGINGHLNPYESRRL